MRHWKTLSTSFATLCARLSLVASTVIINGVARRHMTDDEFGLWSVLFSINLFTNTLDFGFRSTLGNRLAALGAGGAKAEPERHETFLAITYLLVAISGVLVVLALAVAPLLQWGSLLKIKDPVLGAEAHRLIPIALALMLGTLPVSTLLAVFYAYLEIKLASLLTGLSAMGQAAVFVVAVYRGVPFGWVMLLYFGSAIVIGAVMTGYVFLRRKWRLKLLPVSRIVAVTQSMARVSLHFSLMTISNFIQSALGTIFCGTTAGLAAAGDFTLIQKVFSLLITAHLGLLAPQTPAVTLEAQSGNWDSIRRRLRICVLQLWPVLFLGPGMFLLWQHPLVIRIWGGTWLRNYPLAALLLVWVCLNGFVNTFAVFLNSLGLVKMQATVMFAMIIPSLVLPLVLSHWFGSQGIALSMVLCMLPAAIIWPLYTRRALRLHLHRV